EVRDDSGAGRPGSSYPFEPELEILGLVPRPAPPGVGPAPRGNKPRAKDRGLRGEPMGEPGTWSHRGQSARDRRAQLKSSGAVPGAGPGGGAGRAKAVNRNGKRLLVYVLDVAATLSQNQVVVDLARRQRKATGEWGPLRPWYYAPRAAHVKYDPEDRLLLALLDEAPGNPLHAALGSPTVAGPGHAPAYGPGSGPCAARMP